MRLPLIEITVRYLMQEGRPFNDEDEPLKDRVDIRMKLIGNMEGLGWPDSSNEEWQEFCLWRFTVRCALKNVLWREEEALLPGVRAYDSE